VRSLTAAVIGLRHQCVATARAEPGGGDTGTDGVRLQYFNIKRTDIVFLD